MACNEALFKDVVLRLGMCDRIQLGKANEKSKANHLPLANNLIILGYLDGEQVAECYAVMSKQGPKPLVYTKNPERLEIDTLGAGYFSEEEFQKRQFIPLTMDDQAIVFMVDPFNDELLDYISSKYSIRFEVGVISNSKLELILNTNYSSLNLLSGRNASLNSRLDEIEKTDTDITTSFYNIIRSAIRDRASDIHFIQSDVDATVTVRIDGDIHIVETTTKSVIQRYISKLLEFTEVTDTNDKVPRTGKAKISLGGGKDVHLRVSIIPGKFGPDINARIITDTAINVANLGFTDKQLSDYKRVLSLSKGLILIVGPTGSGKSTSLYGGLSMIRSKKIMSVEDPVEYVVPGMLQVDVNDDGGVSFDKVVRAFMRHDPDIIVVGEIRDLQVAESAVIAANTGHLVISTLHTNSAITAANRLITMGVDRYSICEELSVVMSQRLIKRVCPQCKEEVILEEDNPWIKTYGLKAGDKVAKGRGCVACKHTGYLGRVAVTEILRVDKHIRDAIEKQLPTGEIEEIAQKHGFIPMLDDAISKAKEGITTFEQVDKLRFDLE